MKQYLGLVDDVLREAEYKLNRTGVDMISTFRHIINGAESSPTPC
jgi:hypothetical protein